MYSMFVHQHTHVYPECAEPYGLHSFKVVPHREPGIMETRGFLVSDIMMKGLSRDELPCYDNSDNEELSYTGGVGECIDGKITKINLVSAADGLSVT